MKLRWWQCNANTYKLCVIVAVVAQKNTKNKALHTKLLNRKKAKVQQEKKEKVLRLKVLVSKMNQQKSSGEFDAQ